MGSISKTDILLVCIYPATLWCNRSSVEFPTQHVLSVEAVLYHQPEKMAKSKEDLAERQDNLEKLKRQHGIE